LVLLREQILGPEDLIGRFANSSVIGATVILRLGLLPRYGQLRGEDLSWFWRGWYFSNSTLDLAVQSVGPVQGIGARVHWSASPTSIRWSADYRGDQLQRRKQPTHSPARRSLD